MSRVRVSEQLYLDFTQHPVDVNLRRRVRRILAPPLSGCRAFCFTVSQACIPEQQYPMKIAPGSRNKPSSRGTLCGSRSESVTKFAPLLSTESVSGFFVSKSCISEQRCCVETPSSRVRQRISNFHLQAWMLDTGRRHQGCRCRSMLDIPDRCLRSNVLYVIGPFPGLEPTAAKNTRPVDAETHLSLTSMRNGRDVGADSSAVGLSTCKVHRHPRYIARTRGVGCHDMCWYQGISSPGTPADHRTSINRQLHATAQHVPLQFAVSTVLSLSGCVGAGRFLRGGGLVPCSCATVVATALSTPLLWASSPAMQYSYKTVNVHCRKTEPGCFHSICAENRRRATVSLR